MNGLLILLAALAFLIVPGCARIGAAVDELGLAVPPIDTAASAGDQVGGCVRLVCEFPPIGKCRVRPGRCQRN